MIEIFMSLVLYLLFPLFLCAKMLHILIECLLLENVSISEYIFMKSLNMKNINILDTNYVSYISKIT